ncbi:ArsR/SmtB family transcription factor [Gemella cuniculi]|uniref:ArsR/SmtB family transcription factor n=1 Tax=Gemella cuniculi TaxID=150240 RepID=UPI00041C4141|nr:metalloregulator ArsR/SmtB family transcription factor [Gemella cuniculi]
MDNLEFKSMMVNISDEKLEKILALFHVLRNKTRFKILCLLLEKERNVTELERETGGSQSAISHQLALLKKMKLVKDRQEKRMRYYSIYDNHVTSIIDAAISHISEDC